MDLTTTKSLIYGFIAGFTDILPVSARAHSILLLKIFGAENIVGLPALLIHLAVFASIYYSSQKTLVRVSRALRLARIPKKRRKRPLDVVSIMDFRFWRTTLLPVILAILIFGKINTYSVKLVWLALLLAINGLILYIPQFLPSSNKDARTLSRAEGLLMGLGNALSVLPGFSGIGASISAGSVCGVERSYALNVSLLTNLVFTVGLIVYDILTIVTFGFGDLSFSILIKYILTAFVAFVGSTVGIRIMRNLASGRGFAFFSYYCWGLALFAFILNLMA